MSDRNPFLNRIKSHGRESERRLAKSVGADLMPASGALDGAKGDMDLGDWKIEAKSTIADSLAIKREWLEKITREATATDRVPMVAISFVTDAGTPRQHGDWVMIPKYMLWKLEL